MDQLNQVHLNGLRAVEVAGRLGTLALAAAELGSGPIKPIADQLVF